MSSLGNPSILVAEDDGDVRAVLSLLLAGVSRDVELVLCGREALDCLSRRTYDLLICDIHMPDMSGIELFEIVQESYPNLTAMAISGFLSPEKHAQLEALGVRFLAKPFTATELFAALEAALNPQPQNTP